MSMLYRHELDFDRTIEFVKENLNDISALSNELLNLVDFKSGAFFTLLTFGSDLNRLYEFKNGIILPQNPIIESEIDGSRHTRTPTIKEGLSNFIFNKLYTNKRLSCVFDDVTCEPNDSSLESFYESKSLYLHKKEVLYVVKQDNNNAELISDCVWNSFSFWHSVGVLTESDCFENDTNVLSSEDIQNICRHTNTIIISAYDGEAYILWEKAL